MPKEMLPLVDKPLIQYGVEEAIHSGVQNIIIVTGRGKTAIEDHFDVSFELEHLLETRSKPEPAPVAAKSAGRKRVQGDLFVENRAADLTRMFDKVREELRAMAAILK